MPCFKCESVKKLTAYHFYKDKEAVKKKENVTAGSAGSPACNDAKRRKLCGEQST
jgi:hypothetical protein